MCVCCRERRAVVPVSCAPTLLKTAQAWAYSRDRFINSQSQVHDLTGCRQVEHLERSTTRRDTPALDEIAQPEAAA